MIVTEHFDYRSQNEKEEILQHLLKLIDLDRPTIILGDIKSIKEMSSPNASVS